MRIEYSSSDIKKKYKSIVSDHAVVNSIIYALKRIIKLNSGDTEKNDIKITNVINELYIEKIVTEECDEDITSLIKRIGVKSGKEKR